MSMYVIFKATQHVSVECVFIEGCTIRHARIVAL